MLNTAIQGDGWPLVWGHGQMGSMILEDAMGWFHPSEEDGLVRRIRYDARGHGQSPASLDAADYRWPRLAQDMLRTARQHCGQSRVALGGQSMGCATALHAALAAPQQVSHLVLALPPHAWSIRPAQARRSAQMAELIGKRGLSSLVRLTAGHSTLPSWLLQHQPLLAQQMLHEMGGFQPEVLQAILLGAADSDLPPLAQLGQLSIPTLILAWHGDSLHPVESAALLADVLPAAQLRLADSVDEVRSWPERISRFIREAH